MPASFPLPSLTVRDAHIISRERVRQPPAYSLQAAAGTQADLSSRFEEFFEPLTPILGEVL
eukprot:7259811-Karenia_brevis.AAC.1